MMLEIKEVTKYYGNHLALEKFSTTIRSGEIVGLIGKNGSGKTTLMNCLVNHIHFTSGQILIDGKNLMENKSLISRFGVLIESSFLDYMSAYDNLKLLLELEQKQDKRKADQQLSEILKLVGLYERRKERVKNYSFGMKQRLGLAQALLNHKPLLILDEPLVGLDVMGRELVKEIIRNKARNEECAVIFSDHNLNEVKDICDRIIYLDNGTKMYDGVFEDHKKYAVTPERLDKELLAHAATIGEHVLAEPDILMLDSIAELNSVLQILVRKNISVKELEVIEGSLIRLFKGDMNNADHANDMQNRIPKTFTS
ncbi:ABC transporter ATP-binding protein [Saccharibacillus sacchari]|uniref:ABC transporter ATP-binding protein n=1 Tax=Saccharibacillus sacchari TaxID=456493 RepID=A0ACC6P8W4_9BACL